MKYKKEIYNKLQNISEDLEVRLDVDVSEERTSPFVLTVIEKSKTVINVGLPDYKISYDILLDCFIADDPNGENFSSFANSIEEKMEEMSDRFESIHDRFESPEIVGCFYNGSVDGLTNSSNQRKYSLDLIISE